LAGQGDIAEPVARPPQEKAHTRPRSPRHDDPAAREGSSAALPGLLRENHRDEVIHRGQAGGCGPSGRGE